MFKTLFCKTCSCFAPRNKNKNDIIAIQRSVITENAARSSAPQCWVCSLLVLIQFLILRRYAKSGIIESVQLPYEIFIPVFKLQSFPALDGWTKLADCDYSAITFCTNTCTIFKQSDKPLMCYKYRFCIYLNRFFCCWAWKCNTWSTRPRAYMTPVLYCDMCHKDEPL